MFKWIGFAAGCAIAWVLDPEFLASVALIALGLGVGIELDRRRKPPGGTAGAPLELMQRLARLERRMDAIEAAVTGARPVLAPREPAPPADANSEIPEAEVRGAGIAITAAAATDDGRIAEADSMAAPPPRPAYGAAPTSPVPGAVVEGVCATPAATPVAARRSAWTWFTEGNTMTRVGVVILFFGVAFLLSWFADQLTLSVEVALALVAGAGAALIALGAKLAAGRPGYALSLEGAGAGILYLTTFAASRVFDVLPPVPALLALVAVAALTVA
ncbi:MAG: DUF2339 domain-containing protein, partial [Betaproteobacteria bacterium PRO3]|nr:DUF2339 domain-containing protein [Betaproteobacteria bacterium PRO3]